MKHDVAAIAYVLGTMTGLGFWGGALVATYEVVYALADPRPFWLAVLALAWTLAIAAAASSIWGAVQLRDRVDRTITRTFWRLRSSADELERGAAITAGAVLVGYIGILLALVGHFFLRWWP